MIFSDRQLSISKRQLEKLESALAAVRSAPTSNQTWLREIEANALQSQITDILVEIQEYEMLRAGHVSFSERYSLADLPRILIQARIAQGLSQSDLAAELDMKPQQIQRYEATEYMGASLSRLIAISDRLGIRMSESFSTGENGAGSFLAWTSPDDVAWDKFPAKEMFRRGWIQPIIGQSDADAIRSYFYRVAGQQFVSALHRKKIRGSTLPNEIALLAWQARILELANRTIKATTLTTFSENDVWLSELVCLTQEIDGPRRAKDLLEQHGIILVIEPHLPGTYLDGAAMVSDSHHPIIGMTLRYDRLDNFWFVLFHELGHVFLHLFDNVYFDFFDEEGPIGRDHLEVEADEFALNALIPDDQWELCLSRFAPSTESVELDAERLSIHPSIIAGRIRKELNDYTLLSDLVGHGKVRNQFEDLYS